jgi:hypothetical protein
MYNIRDADFLILESLINIDTSVLFSILNLRISYIIRSSIKHNGIDRYQREFLQTTNVRVED